MGEFSEPDLVSLWKGLIDTPIMSDPNGPGTTPTRDEPDIAPRSRSVSIGLHQLEGAIETIANMFGQ